MSLQGQKFNQTANNLGQNLNKGQKNIDNTVQNVGQVELLSLCFSSHLCVPGCDCMSFAQRVMLQSTLVLAEVDGLRGFKRWSLCCTTVHEEHTCVITCPLQDGGGIK